MTAFRLTAFGLLLATAAGCGQSDAPPPATATESLTIEQWKAMPPETKFTIATFERLKESNPKLREVRDWERFARDVIQPAKKAAKK